MTQPNPETELVSVTPRTELSFHQLQDIYSTLTGKSEKISSQFLRSYQINFNDFENLHARILQCCESYGTQIKNESITVYHVRGQSEQFSSFDRFRVYNQSNTSPVENVNIEYNFIIIPAGSTEPKQYKIRISLPSRVGIFEKHPDMSVGPISLISMLSRISGGFQIEFSDYAVARHYQTQIEEWYEALDFGKDRKLLTKFQNVSHFLRSIFAFLAMLVVAKSFYVPDLKINGALVADDELFNRIVLFFGMMTAAYFIGTSIGRIIEWGVDRLQSLSYVKLNKGDEKLISKWRNRYIAHIGVVAFGLVMGVTTNILATKIIENWF